MNRRVSRPAAAFLALIISLSAPVAFAASRDQRGSNPDVRTRIVQMLQKFLGHFGVIGYSDNVSPPKP